MSAFSKPKFDQTDGDYACRDAMRKAFRSLVEQALAAGWEESEVVVCLADISEEYVMEVWQRSNVVTLR